MQEATLNKLKRTGKKLAKLLKEEKINPNVIGSISFTADGYVHISVAGEHWCSIGEGFHFSKR